VVQLPGEALPGGDDVARVLLRDRHTPSSTPSGRYDTAPCLGHCLWRVSGELVPADAASSDDSWPQSRRRGARPHRLEAGEREYDNFESSALVSLHILVADARNCLSWYSVTRVSR
jgi:hypothetical protein